MDCIKKKAPDLVDRLHELSANGRTCNLLKLAREAADTIENQRATTEQQAVQEATAAVADQMRGYMDQDVEPGFHVLERWVEMLATQPQGQGKKPGDA